MKTKLFFLATAITLITACGNPDDNSINLFSIEDDKDLGLKVNTEIQSNPQEYPVLSRTQYPQAYAYVEAMRDKILAGGNVYYKDEFAWEVYIINDDNVLNAFCTPGGYIYIYTGLIHFLEAEHELAGVLGHEMAHADRRHSTDQLTQIYGLQLMLDILLGQNQNDLTNIAASLVTLSFSRSHETEADTYSVNYLCPTDYRADGAANFFQLLIDEGQSGSTPVFLSTHPDPGNRVQNITDQRNEQGCTGTGTFDAAYNNFKNSLP
jgi:predicted Zn-dependent protease